MYINMRRRLHLRKRCDKKKHIHACFDGADSYRDATTYALRNGTCPSGSDSKTARNAPRRRYTRTLGRCRCVYARVPAGTDAHPEFAGCIGTQACTCVRPPRLHSVSVERACGNLQRGERERADFVSLLFHASILFYWGQISRLGSR